MREQSGKPDFFGARYYSSAQGRFLTPDWSASPEAVPYADLSNPQSLNLYSYVLNNPATATDPDGHFDGPDCHCLGWLTSAYRWVSGIFDGFVGTPSNVQSPAESAGNCGNPCIAASTAASADMVGTAGAATTDTMTAGLGIGLTDALTAVGSVAVAGVGSVLALTLGQTDGDPATLARVREEDKSGASDSASADSLIPGKLKASPSYHSELGGKTYGEIKAEAKAGNQRARQMKKLIEQATRLMGKSRG